MHAGSSVLDRKRLDKSQRPNGRNVLRFGRMVKVISDTIQEFCGVRYYRCGRYFQRKGVRLHRAVWESVHGPVPDGYHVHHIDHDAENNAPGNLSLVESRAHISHHSSEPENVRRITDQLSNARKAAAEWHGSEAGRRWHSQQYETVLRKRMAVTVEKHCQQCGKAYRVVAPKAGESKFCHPNCKARALRARRRAQRTG